MHSSQKIKADAPPKHQALNPGYKDLQFKTTHAHTHTHTHTRARAPHKRTHSINVDSIESRSFPARRQDMSTLVRRMNLAMKIPGTVVMIAVGTPI